MLSVINKLQKVFDGRNINYIGWDFDDTLIDTREVFNKALIDAGSFLLFGKSVAEINDDKKILEAITLKKDVIDLVIRSFRPEFGVNPIMMELAVKTTAKIMGIDSDEERIYLAINRVKAIYSIDIPDTFDGAIEAVDLINKCNVHSYLITHAGSDWTWYKRLKTGFVGKFEKVVCLSVDLPKSIQLSNFFKTVDPSGFMMIGDNFSADIAPIIKAGGYGVWVTNGRSKTFRVEPGFKDDSLIDQSKIIEVDSVGKVIQALIQRNAGIRVKVVK